MLDDINDLLRSTINVMMMMMMMSRRLFLQSSSCVLVFLLCLISHECSAGRHLSTINHHAAMDDDKAKLLNHSTIKGFGTNSLLTVPVDLNLQRTEKVIKNQTNTFDNDKGTDCGSKNMKKDKIKYQKVKKFKDAAAVHRRHQRKHDHPSSISFQVPPKNKQVRHQQPGFNLDYSPPKTHPPSHN